MRAPRKALGISNGDTPRTPRRGDRCGSLPSGETGRIGNEIAALRALVRRHRSSLERSIRRALTWQFMDLATAAERYQPTQAIGALRASPFWQADAGADSREVA
jgi:hypothetical protein